MYVLVDYANVKRLFTRGGLKTMVVTITEEVCNLIDQLPERLLFRMYGGWYNGQEYTRLAQELSLIIDKEYPLVYKPVTEKANQGRLRIQVELAYAMLIDPSHNLTRTVRKRRGHHSLWVNSPQDQGCIHSECHLRGLLGLFKDGSCTHPSCCLGENELIGLKREQKLVDTMLTTDLIHVSMSEDNAVVLVSSDDDMIPAVRQSILMGTTLIHLHTGSRKVTPDYYIAPHELNYIQSSLK